VTRSIHGAIFWSSPRARSSISIFGMSIRTGHAYGAGAAERGGVSQLLHRARPPSIAVRRMRWARVRVGIAVAARSAGTRHTFKQARSAGS